MVCENNYCIYQENGRCLLDRISLDMMGQCTECILVAPEETELLRRKRAQRGESGTSFAPPGRKEEAFR